jgi:hypothetical protein
MKQGTSGNISKDKSGTKPEQEAGRAVPDETVTGSRSLEELLGIVSYFVYIFMPPQSGRHIELHSSIYAYVPQIL